MKKILTPVLIIVILMLSNEVSLAQPGAIDTYFGTNGWVKYVNDDNANGFRNFGIQPDGKFIVYRHGYLGRYNSNGTLDNTFGTAGWKRLDYTVSDMVIQADGSILLLVSGGRIFKHDATTGTIDLTWGEEGSVTISLPAVQLTYNSIALDTKGRIVVAGQAIFGSDPVIKTTSVARLNADGSLDPTFNGTGIRNQLYLDYVERNAFECGVDGNDKIVITVKTTAAEHIILKYNPDGKLDLGFGGGDGELSPGAFIERLAVDAGGKIAITTVPLPNNGIPCGVIYFNPDGSVISTTSLSGLIGVTAIDFQSDGKLVIAGYSALRLTMVRFKTDGSRDESFFNGQGQASIMLQSNIKPAEMIYYNRRLFLSGFIDAIFNNTGAITDANAFLLAIDATDKRLICNMFNVSNFNTDAGKCYSTLNSTTFDPFFVPLTATGTIQYQLKRNDVVVEQGTGSVNGKTFPVGQTEVTYSYTDITTQSCQFWINVSDKEAPTAKTKNITVQLNAAGTAGITAADVDDGSSDPCGIQSRTLSKTSFDCTNVGANTVTLTVKDANNNTSTADVTVTIEDKVAPEAKCKNVTIYLDATGKATIGTSDIDDGCSDACGIKSLSLSKTEYDCSNKGNNQVTLTATDNNNNTSACTATVAVVDDLAPIIASVTPDPALLWPADRKMKNVTINTSFTDNCPGTTCVITNVIIKQGEFPGDNINPDWEITGANTVNLRAEIPKKGIKRIYTVTITCTDGAGNISTSSADAVVAHNITSPPSGATVKIGSIVTLTGEFWDQPNKKHTAKWLIDDKAINGSVTEPAGTTNGKVTGSYKFSSAGVYKLRMNVTDQNGYTTYANTYEHLDAIVVVYDPNGGYTYGGGYFNSPAGALITDPTSTGEASYGFTMNYFKNSTYPKGETQFEFKVGDFEFNALNFDYLVINNSTAQFKGTGKIIGGQSGIGFTMTVVDGQLDGTGIDKIRMKIYNKNNGSIIYDNQFGASDAALPTQAVGTNSVIVINGANANITHSNATQKTEMEATAEKIPTGLDVVAYPNPSANDFSVTVQTNAQEKIMMQVVDMYGRVIEIKNVNANSVIRFGDRYRPGTYFIRVIQGKQHKELNLVKLSD